MARTRSIKRTPRKKSSKKSAPLLVRILPEALQAFVARRLVDVFAIVFVLAGVFVTLALLTYNAQDPSWNTASSDASGVANWMGLRGALVSDLLLQTIGLGGLVFGAVFATWGVRSFNRQPLRPLALRFIAAALSAVCLSVALAQVPSGGWLVHPYLGSSAGTLLLGWAASVGGDGWFGPAVITLVSAVAAIGFGLYAAVVTLAQVAVFLQYSWFTLRNTAIRAFLIAAALRSWIAHYNDPSDRPDLRSVLAAVPRLKVPVHEFAAEDVAVVKPAAKKAAAPVAPQPVPMAPASAQTAQSASSIKVVTPQAAMPPKADPQKAFSLDGADWEFPAADLLEDVPEAQQVTQLNEDALRKNAELLQNVLADFNVEGEITSIHPGPVVTLYELEPAPGTKSAKVIGLADDIARSMSAVSVRVAVVPGRNVIGIELPNKTRQTVYMRELLESQLFEKNGANLPLILGKDIGGQPILADLAKMPHLLVAGTTGSGKSVAVNTMILSLLYCLSPEQCRFIMIDPKMLELSVYDGIPHLLSPVVTEPGKAVVSLKWTVNEMEERYRAMSKLGVRNINGYNERVREAKAKGETIMKKVQTGFDPETGKGVYEDQPMDLVELPYIVVIVDEFADLMLVAGKDVESAIQRLAQMARAAGIHLIMATQRPSVDVITGVIKANFPTRISFQVTSKVYSRTILGEGGAEQLLGMGDMLYMAPGGRVTRVHGPFVADPDVEKVVNDLKSKAEPSYVDGVTSGEGLDASEVMGAIFYDRSGGDEKVDELYDQAVALVAREGKASTSFVQRYLQIGYNRAARIIEEMERQGVISPASATGKREVLVQDFSEAG
jgi:S-DNA-T family DNA segregation ATPase FtsK/SpoIIIE